MAKPKAERWLTEAFRDGVDERDAPTTIWRESGWGKRVNPACWLAQHDPARRPCAGRLERFHFIPRQRVENALGALLPSAGPIIDIPFGTWDWDPTDVILLAAWDPRNGGIACEQHHRRYDSHLTPALVVPHDALPDHVHEFAEDWGLEDELARKCPETVA